MNWELGILLYNSVRQIVSKTSMGMVNGGGWQVFVDNWYKDVLMFRNEEWCYCDRHLNSDNIYILGEIIDKYLFNIDKRNLKPL